MSVWVGWLGRGSAQLERRPSEEGMRESEDVKERTSKCGKKRGGEGRREEKRTNENQQGWKKEKSTGKKWTEKIDKKKELGLLTTKKNIKPQKQNDLKIIILKCQTTHNSKKNGKLKIKLCPMEGWNDGGALESRVCVSEHATSANSVRKLTTHSYAQLVQNADTPLNLDWLSTYCSVPTLRILYCTIVHQAFMLPFILGFFPLVPTPTHGK